MWNALGTYAVWIEKWDGIFLCVEEGMIYVIKGPKTMESDPFHHYFFLCFKSHPNITTATNSHNSTLISW